MPTKTGKGKAMRKMIAGEGKMENITLTGEKSAIRKINDRPKHTIRK
jgi:hypothetical protein